MKKIYTLLVSLLIAASSVTAQETFDWKVAIKAVGEDGYISNEEDCDLVSDQENNLIAVGVLGGAFDFDPSADAELILDQNDNVYPFAAKYTSEGALLWAKIIAVGQYSSVYVTDVQSDDDNNIYTCGYFQGEVDFDPSEDTLTLDAPKGEIAFIQKLDKDGKLLWATKVGTALEASSQIRPNAMRVRSTGIYIAGKFEKKVQFIEGDDASIYDPTSSYWDIFAMKLALDGTAEWAYAVGADGHDMANAIDVDSQGNLYVAGTFEDEIDFAPGPHVENLSATGTSIFIMKIRSEVDDEGDCQIDFAQSYGNGFANVGGIDVVNDSHVYFTGMYTNYFTFVTGEANLSTLYRFENFTACYIPYQYGKEPPFGPQWAVQHTVNAEESEGYPLSKTIVVNNDKIYTTGTREEDNGIDFCIRAQANGELITKPIASAKYFVDPESWTCGFDLCLDATGAVYNLAAYNKYIYFQDNDEVISSDSALSQALILFKHSDKNTAGLNNAVAEDEVLVYPNPATTSISLSHQDEISSIEIHNLQGAMVKQIRTNSAENIPINDLEKGIYFISIYHNNNLKHLTEFVKR